MAPTRRWTVYTLLAFFSILLLYQLRNSGNLERRPTYPSPPPPSSQQHLPPKVAKKPSRWAARPAHYPLEQLTSLPEGRSRVLPKVQHDFGTVKISPQNEKRREQVKKAFSRCWKSYREHAWLRDELRPLTGTGYDSFGGWAATLVDALDTLWIMGMKTEFKEAVAATARIDFSKSSDTVVNVFETTIRYLGGFLGAYDLSGEQALLEKAKEVGEMLLVPFDTPNHMPITRWPWSKALLEEPQTAPSGMLVSELGSLSLEFTRLSQLTGDQRWYDAIQRITTLFDAQQDLTKLPGMWPIIVNPRDVDLTAGTSFTLGGMADSLYEYFPKEYALLGGLMPVYQKLYEKSMSTAIKYLLFRPMTPNNEDILVFGDAQTNIEGTTYMVDHRGQHLTCFAGGMLALGGRLFSNDEHVTLGRKVTDGCIWAYEANERGVMPEIAHFIPCQSRTSCEWNSTAWGEALLRYSGLYQDSRSPEQFASDNKIPQGFIRLDDKRYILRPEAIESVFIMYRITGETKYQEAAWNMFTAIEKISATEFANAAIIDITSTKENGLPARDDRMESFWLAETLKYFYLIFSEPDLISLDDYVFNTEAHPFRRPK